MKFVVHFIALPHHPLLHRPEHQPGMGLYPGFFHDGGAVAHKTAGADVELGGDIGTVGVLAHQADDTELGGVKAHYFQTGGIEKATTDQGGDFAGSGFAVIALSPPSIRPAQFCSPALLVLFCGTTQGDK